MLELPLRPTEPRAVAVACQLIRHESWTQPPLISPTGDQEMEKGTSDNGQPRQNLRVVLRKEERRRLSASLRDLPGGSRVAGLLVLMGFVLCGNNSNAQEWLRSEPVFGTYTVGPTMSPDPQYISIGAPGEGNASDLGAPSTCYGSVHSDRPDARVIVEAGSHSALNFFVDAFDDRTLIIHAPDGSWHCNDDTNGLNPVIQISPVVSGQYDVWVGSFFGNYSAHPDELYVSFVHTSRPSSGTPHALEDTSDTTTEWEDCELPTWRCECGLRDPVEYTGLVCAETSQEADDISMRLCIESRARGCESWGCGCERINSSCFRCP